MSSRLTEVTKFMRKLEAAGCRIESEKRRKFKIHLPNGRIYFAPRTPSDARWRKNLTADLRRMDGELKL